MNPAAMAKAFVRLPQLATFWKFPHQDVRTPAQTRSRADFADVAVPLKRKAAGTVPLQFIHDHIV
jgi:hypothetical protein